MLLRFSVTMKETNMSLSDLTFNDPSALIPEESNKREKKDYNDPRFFKPAIKNAKSKNPEKLPDEYQALIRVLPRGMDFSVPYFQEYKEHNFNVNGKYLIQKCRKTLGEKEICPICAVKWDLWNQSKKLNDEIGMKRSKDMIERSHFICNVLILKDPINPANNGKVMLWKAPAAIRNMILDAQKNGVTTKPVSQFVEASDSITIPPFAAIDPLRGRNIALVVNLDSKGMVSYAASTWQNPAKEQPLAVNANAQPDEVMIREKLSLCNNLVEFIQDVKSVDALNKEYSEWQGKVNGQMMVANSGSPVGVSGFNTNPMESVNTAPNVKRPEAGNSAELFGATTPVNTAPIPSKPVVSTPIPQPQVVSAPVETVGEDDLPF